MHLVNYVKEFVCRRLIFHTFCIYTGVWWDSPLAHKAEYLAKLHDSDLLGYFEGEYVVANVQINYSVALFSAAPPPPKQKKRKKKEKKEQTNKTKQNKRKKTKQNKQTKNKTNKNKTKNKTNNQCRRLCFSCTITYTFWVPAVLISLMHPDLVRLWVRFPGGLTLAINSLCLCKVSIRSPDLISVWHTLHRRQFNEPIKYFQDYMHNFMSIAYPDSKVRRGQHGAHLGPVGPRLAPCWPHEPCYQGSYVSSWYLIGVVVKMERQQVQTLRLANYTINWIGR